MLVSVVFPLPMFPAMAMCILFSGDVFQVSSAKVMNIPEKCKQILFFFLLYALYQLHFIVQTQGPCSKLEEHSPKYLLKFRKLHFKGFKEFKEE
jgi:hypothetical protein